VTKDEIRALAAWNKNSETGKGNRFYAQPRVAAGFHGVPAVVDLAAMRDAMKRWVATRKLIKSAAAANW